MHDVRISRNVLPGPLAGGIPAPQAAGVAFVEIIFMVAHEQKAILVVQQQAGAGIPIQIQINIQLPLTILVIENTPVVIGHPQQFVGAGQ